MTDDAFYFGENDINRYLSRHWQDLVLL